MGAHTHMCMIKQVIVKCQLQLPGIEYINAPIDVLGAYYMLDIFVVYCWPKWYCK